MTQTRATITTSKRVDETGRMQIEAIVSNHQGHSISATVLSPDAGSSPTPAQFSDNTKTKFKTWGANNDDPKRYRQKIEKSTTAYPLLMRHAEMYYGAGLVYYKEKRTQSGIELDYSPDPQVDDFLQMNDIDYLLLERMADYKFHNNMWCEFILSNDKTKIVNLYHKEAEFCRFGETEVGKGIDIIGYGALWPETTDVKEIPFLWRDDITTANLKKIKEKKFTSHSCMPSPGRTLYAIPTHYGAVRENGWIDYANSIPEIMNAINKNVMDIRWHIRIPYEYWPSIYSDWNNIDQDVRDQRISDKLKEMNDFLAGKENAGKAFISHFATDSISQKPLAGWEIVELTSSDRKDKFLTSVQEADIQTSRAIGMDASLSSIQPADGSMGAGSGSDKRVAFNNQITVAPAALLAILEPLRIVQRINGWDPALRFTIRYNVPTTLNENKTGSKTVTQ